MEKILKKDILVQEGKNPRWEGEPDAISGSAANLI